MKSKQIQLFISGKVQGVGFRYSTQQEARKLGIVGWVRNTADERVEVLAAGPENQIETFLAWCRKGPASAKVERLDVVAEAHVESPAYSRFEIHR